MTQTLVTIVTGCYNEVENVRPLYEALQAVFATRPQYRFEILYIDNASQDRTASILRELAAAGVGLALPAAPWFGQRVRTVAFAQDVALAVGALGKAARDIALLHCVSAYPAPIADPLTWIPHPVNTSALSQVWLYGAKLGRCRVQFVLTPSDGSAAKTETINLEIVANTHGNKHKNKNKNQNRTRTSMKIVVWNLVKKAQYLLIVLMTMTASYLRLCELILKLLIKNET